MPMIDVYAAAGTFSDQHALAQKLATELMTIEQVPEIPMFRKKHGSLRSRTLVIEPLERRRGHHLRAGPGPHKRRRPRSRQAARRCEPTHRSCR
jgi:hypothetical protein